MIEEKEIAPHVPVWDKTTRNDNTLSSSEFQWDEQAMNIAAPPGTHYAVIVANSGIRARASRRLTRSAIGQASSTAKAVR
jgi:hypothetical protein